LPGEEIGIAEVGNLLEVSGRMKLSSPAVIIIGEVVALHPDAEEILKEKFSSRISPVSRIEGWVNHPEDLIYTIAGRQQSSTDGKTARLYDKEAD
jgi:hypothetical protein